MKRWLASSAFALALAAPTIGQAQYTTDTTRRMDTTIVRTEVVTKIDTVYRTNPSNPNTVDTLYLTPSRTRYGMIDTTYRTPPTYATTTYSSTTTTVKQQDYDDDHDQKAGFEVKGGASWGNVSNRGVLPGSLRGRNGMALGIGMHGGSPVGFGLEGLWVQRGVFTDVFTVNSRELDYIDVPGYLRLSVPFALQPFILAGPMASFEIRCRSGSANCPDTGRPTTSWSAIIGAGIRFNPGVALSIEGRYVYGLTDLHLSTITSSSSYRTRSFMLLAGIGI